MIQIDFNEVGKGIAGYIWASVLFWIPIIYLIFRYQDKLQIAWGFISSFMSFWKWCRKSSIKNTLEGNLNSFARRINGEFNDLILPKAKIEFINEKNLESFINNNQPIIRVNFSRNNNENLANVALTYVKVALLDRARNYIQKDITSSIDLNIARRMLIEYKQSEPVSYFDSRFLLPEFEKTPDVKNYYNRVQEIDDAGLLTRLLIREYKDLGDAIFPAVPSEEHQLESVEFFNFVHALSIRAKEEETPLSFNKKHIHLGIILVSKRTTYETYGLEAYLRRIRLLTKYGITTFYLFARGEKHAEILNQLRTSLLSNINFREVCFKKYYTKDQISAFSLVKLDYEGFVSQAKSVLSEAQKKNETVDAIIVRVEKDCVEVDINGTSVTVPTCELSSKPISDARKYFQSDEDLKLRVVSFTSLSDVVVSNKNTDTDPVVRIEKNYSSDRTLKAHIAEIKDAGLLVKLEDGMDGFVPCSRATFSRYQRLENIYKIGQNIEVNPVSFNPIYKSLVVSISKLKDPWEDIKTRYRLNQIYQVQVRSIEEKKVLCELEPGVEGVIWRSDLDWVSSDINVLNIKVGDTISVKIKNINFDWKIIQLSRKEALTNPVEVFYENNRALELEAKVTNIVEKYAAEIEFDKDIKGVVHVSEIDWNFVPSIATICPIGSKIKVRLLCMDPERNIIFASRKHVLPNPAKAFLGQYKIGQKIKGKIINNESWGARVEVDGRQLGVNCLVVKGEISRLFYVENATKLFEKGQEYTFVIKAVDVEKQRVLLSRKQLFDDSFQDTGFQYDKEYKARVIGKTDQEAYVVECDDSFQALLIPSQKKVEKIVKFTIGSIINVCVARIDTTNKLIEVYLAP